MDGFSKFQRHMFTIDSKPINFYAKNLFPWLLPIASLCLRKWGEGLHIPLFGIHILVPSVCLCVCMSVCLSVCLYVIMLWPHNLTTNGRIFKI